MTGLAPLQSGSAISFFLLRYLLSFWVFGNQSTLLWLFSIGLLWAAWMVFELSKVPPFPFFALLAPYFWPAYLTIVGGLGYLLAERYARSEVIEQNT